MKNVRIRLQMPETVLEVLQTLATRRGVNVATALRQAISTESYFDSAIAQGRQVFTEQDGTLRRVVFPWLASNDKTDS